MSFFSFCDRWGSLETGGLLQRVWCCCINRYWNICWGTLAVVWRSWFTLGSPSASVIGDGLLRLVYSSKGVVVAASNRYWNRSWLLLRFSISFVIGEDLLKLVYSSKWVVVAASNRYWNRSWLILRLSISSVIGEDLLKLVYFLKGVVVGERIKCGRLLLLLQTGIGTETDSFLGSSSAL